jgi:hypothetical protein
MQSQPGKEESTDAERMHTPRGEGSDNSASGARKHREYEVVDRKGNVLMTMLTMSEDEKETRDGLTKKEAKTLATRKVKEARDNSNWKDQIEKAKEKRNKGPARKTRRDNTPRMPSAPERRNENALRAAVQAGMQTRCVQAQDSPSRHADQMCASTGLRKEQVDKFLQWAENRRTTLVVHGSKTQQNTLVFNGCKGLSFLRACDGGGHARGRRGKDPRRKRRNGRKRRKRKWSPLVFGVRFCKKWGSHKPENCRQNPKNKGNKGTGNKNKNAKK